MHSLAWLSLIPHIPGIWNLFDVHNSTYYPMQLVDAVPICPTRGGGGLLAFVRDSPPVDVHRRPPREGGGSLGGEGRLAAEEGFCGGLASRGHNHHFHCNNIGVIQVCTVGWLGTS